MPIRKKITLNKIELSYLEWQQGTEPLILLHGLADHALVWCSLGDHLKTNYHVVAPDLRGHGESSKPETGYSSAEIIADLEALMVQLGWSDAHVLGHSWSGKIAAIWATEHPERFRSLILADPFFVDKIPSWLTITFPLLYRVLPFLKGMGPFASYEKAEKVARKLKQYRDWSPLQQQVFRASIELKRDGKWGSKFTVAARNEVFADVMLKAGLTKIIATPTLFIQPERGINRSQWQLKPYQIYLPNLEIKAVPGNHWAFLVEPKAFNQVVENFLDNLKTNEKGQMTHDN